MSLIPFIYNESPIRVVTDDAGEPWFVAKDVCALLGIADVRQAVERLDDDERGGCQIPTPGGEQEVRAVNESGLYTLILRSDKPEAKPFRKWVTGEVLPAIRKNGTYTAPAAAPRSAPKLPLVSQEYRAALSLAKMVGLVGNAAKIAADQAVQKMGHPSVLRLMDAELVNEHQERHLTPTDLGGLMPSPVSARAMNQRLLEIGFQTKQAGEWVPTEAGRKWAVLVDSGKRHNSGAPIQQLKWRAGILDVLNAKAQGAA